MGADIEDLSSKIEGEIRRKVKNPRLKKKLLPLSDSSKAVVSSAELESDKAISSALG